MRTQSSDTNSEIEQVQIALLRQAPLTKRFALIEAWMRCNQKLYPLIAPAVRPLTS